MVDKQKLDKLYDRYNHRKYVSPDPLQFLYNYPRAEDREIVGFIASSLAYGRVAQIIKSVSAVLDRLGPSPHDFLLDLSDSNIKGMFSGFKHRFTTEDEVEFMLACLRNALKKYGSLNNCFLEGYSVRQENVLQPLLKFISRVTCRPGSFCNSLFPSASGSSALKRLNLYLRWMVREDDVDPGGWQGIEASKLIVPLDVHMHRISKQLGLTCRKQADMKTAMEITLAFKNICPRDPIKYDFALTRLGIKKDGYIF